VTATPAPPEPCAWMLAAAKEIAGRWLMTGGDPVDWPALYENMGEVIARHAPAAGAKEALTLCRVVLRYIAAREFLQDCGPHELVPPVAEMPKGVDAQEWEQAAWAALCIAVKAGASDPDALRWQLRHRNESTRG